MKELIESLNRQGLKASEYTHNGETYVIGICDGQRFCVIPYDGDDQKFDIYWGHSVAPTAFAATIWYLEDVAPYIKSNC